MTPPLFRAAAALMLACTTLVAQPLASEPLRIESLGFSMMVPDGANMDSSRVADTTTVRIAVPGENWVMNVQTPRGFSSTVGVPEIAQSIIDRLKESAGRVDGQGQLVETTARILDRVQNLEINGVRGERFYVLIPGSGRSPGVVNGYTVFPAGKGQFITVDILVPEPDFLSAQLIYETLVATTRLVDPAMLAADRGAALESGMALFQRMTPDDYDTIFEPGIDQYFRYYEPAPTGAESDEVEVGYRRLRAWKGQRGELDPRRARSRWKAADLEQGYLVRIDFRGLAGPTTLDSEGIYFMSLDRSEEAWALRMAIKEGSKTTVVNETGARDERTMTVTTRGFAGSGSVKPMVPDQGYITKVERFLLPRFVIPSGIAADFAFYVHDSKRRNIHIRRDALEELTDQPGVWRLVTRHVEDEGNEVGFYRADGSLLRADLPDGRRMEPIEARRLLSLWSSKGLPTD